MIDNIILTIKLQHYFFFLKIKSSTFRPRLGVHKGMERNGMYLSKGKEWNGMELSNLDWMF